MHLRICVHSVCVFQENMHNKNRGMFLNIPNAYNVIIPIRHAVHNVVST